MATGSVALICTNAMRGYDDNGDNLRQLEVVFCGCNKQRMNYCPRSSGKYFFAHELLGNIFLPTNCTNGHEWLQWIKWRPGRSHELALMQGGLIEASPVAYCLPGRINAIASSRGLRPRLLSLRSVLPSRQIAMLCSACQAHCPRLLLSNVVPLSSKTTCRCPIIGFVEISATDQVAIKL